MNVAGVILAGGQSRRMGGGDKTLLDLAGRPILAHVIAKLAPQVSTMALNANGDGSRFDGYGLPVVADSIDGFAGPLAGVLAGMDWAAKQGYSQVVSVAADTPFFPEHLTVALKMAVEAERKPLAMAVTPDPERGFNRHPTFGLWDVDLRDNLRQALQDGLRKVVQWTSLQGCACVSFDGFGFDPFFNVNTPQDLIRANEIIGGLP